MSFILDALKKSESDRQRQTGPALFEVKVAAPKSRLPVWAIAVGVLLIINMLIVGWLLLRRPARQDEGAVRGIAQEASTSGNTAAMSSPSAASGNASRSSVAGPSVALIQPSPGSAGVGVAAPAQPANIPPAALPRNPAPGESGYPAPSGSGANPGSIAGAAANAPPYPGAYTNSTPPNSAGQASFPPAAANAPAAPAGGAAAGHNPNFGTNEPTLGGTPPAQGAGSEGGNPDDYAPAAEPGGAPFKGHVKRGTESGYVLYQDAALVPGANLPQLRLDLHVYAPKPEDRFALINMKKMREGDTLPDGIKVENIIPDGVVMSHNGSKFLLPRD